MTVFVILVNVAYIIFGVIVISSSLAVAGPHSGIFAGAGGLIIGMGISGIIREFAE
jgi:hypothetical protein